MPSAVVQDGTDLRQRGPSAAERQATDVVSRAFDGDLVDVGTFLGAPASLGTKREVEAELDAMAQFIRRFYQMPADQVLKYVGAFSARLTELTVQLHRVEADDRQYTRVRTQQVQKWLDELDTQFKVASRLIEVQRIDLLHLRGGV